MIALAFRLNLPAIQIVQAAMAPTQLLLIIPFVRLGEWILRLPPEPVSIKEALALLAQGAGHAVARALGRDSACWICLDPGRALCCLFALQIADACLRARRRANPVAAAGSIRPLRLHIRVRSGLARFAEWRDEFGSAA